MPTKTVNLLIVFLGVIVLAVVVGCIVLVDQDKTVPGELVALGSLALGALVTLLTRPPTDTAGVAAQVIANQPPPVDLSKLEAGARALLEGVQQTGGTSGTTIVSPPTVTQDSGNTTTGTPPEVPIV